jgi:hypothetical protein
MTWIMLMFVIGTSVQISRPPYHLFTTEATCKEHEAIVDRVKFDTRCVRGDHSGPL